jgi:hypothetical protein
MTYFSDFDYQDDFINNESLRKSILDQANDLYEEPSTELLPEDILTVFEEVY